jgi:hypothetical protein
MDEIDMSKKNTMDCRVEKNMIKKVSNQESQK